METITNAARGNVDARAGKEVPSGDACTERALTTATFVLASASADATGGAGWVA